MASAVGTSVAAWNYAKTVEIPWKIVGFAGISAGSMSFLGATLQSWLPAAVLKPIILILIVGIALYTFSQKKFGQEDQLKVPEKDIPKYAALIGAILGFYNGFVGPGTGSLLVFGFVGMIGYSFLRASAIAKVINVVADVSSLVFFIWHKYILFHLVIPLMVCNVAGSYLGSRMAVLRGNAFIRKVFIVVIGGVVLRFAYDVFG